MIIGAIVINLKKKSFPNQWNLNRDDDEIKIKSMRKNNILTFLYHTKDVNRNYYLKKSFTSS